MNRARGSRLIPFRSLFHVSGEGAAARGTLSPIASENHVGAFHSVARIATVTTVRIQFHKILSEGRSVRYDADPEGAVIHLSVIVTEDEARRNRAKRSA